MVMASYDSVRAYALVMRTPMAKLLGLRRRALQLTGWRWASGARVFHPSGISWKNFDDLGEVLLGQEWCPPPQQHRCLFKPFHGLNPLSNLAPFF